MGKQKEPYKIIPYRDTDGYVIRDKIPIFGKLKSGGGHTSAVLLWCPELEQLQWIGHCEKCDKFFGHERYEGVRCKTNKEINAGKPAYYD